ncbi:hypothetical protein LJC48_07735 [Desulfovibrio sp. OttesenSCG-928-C06]|nr:hypothetical protein [Desulfovibrio sp. OttesenSCG-928-C06]
MYSQFFPAIAVMLLAGGLCALLGLAGLFNHSINPILRKSDYADGGAPHGLAAMLALSGCFFSIAFALYTSQAAIGLVSTLCFMLFLMQRHHALEGGNGKVYECGAFCLEHPEDPACGHCA